MTTSMTLARSGTGQSGTGQSGTGRTSPALVATLGLVATLSAVNAGCSSELPDCQAQLLALDKAFYGESPERLRVEHFASFERLPQHHATACVTEVLHHRDIDAELRARFERIAPLWRAAVADRNASTEPEVDDDGLIRASPSGDFYERACAMGHEAACERRITANEVIACSRGTAHRCPSAAERVTRLDEFPQAFATPVTLMAKACAGGSAAYCDELNARSDLAMLNPDYAAQVCETMPGEELCRRGAESKRFAQLARAQLCTSLKVDDFCDADDTQP